MDNGQGVPVALSSDHHDLPATIPPAYTSVRRSYPSNDDDSYYNNSPKNWKQNHHKPQGVGRESASCMWPAQSSQHHPYHTSHDIRYPPQVSPIYRNYYHRQRMQQGSPIPMVSSPSMMNNGDQLSAQQQVAMQQQQVALQQQQIQQQQQQVAMVQQQQVVQQTPTTILQQAIQQPTMVTSQIQQPTMVTSQPVLQQALTQGLTQQQLQQQIQQQAIQQQQQQMQQQAFQQQAAQQQAAQQQAIQQQLQQLQQQQIQQQIAQQQQVHQQAAQQQAAQLQQAAAQQAQQPTTVLQSVLTSGAAQHQQQQVQQQTVQQQGTQQATLQTPQQPSQPPTPKLIHQGQHSGSTLPPLDPTQANKLISRSKLVELVREVDPNEQLDEDVEDLLLQLADDFVESCITAACMLAKHRRASTVEVKDVQLHLERNWNMWIPGFGTDELKPYKRPSVTEAHKQRLSLIRKTLKKY